MVEGVGSETLVMGRLTFGERRMQPFLQQFQPAFERLGLHWIAMGVVHVSNVICLTQGDYLPH